jgi:diamine N-acetyltransferase
LIIGRKSLIQLRPITPENHAEIRKLSVREDQRQFVGPVEKSLADAYVYPEATFRAAFNEDTAVGCVLVYAFDGDGGRIANIVRLLIDARFQGRGFGRETLNATLAWIGRFSPMINLVRISTLPENEVALKLYQSVGFQKRGIESGEIALYRSLEIR